MACLSSTRIGTLSHSNLPSVNWSMRVRYSADVPPTPKVPASVWPNVRCSLSASVAEMVLWAAPVSTSTSTGVPLIVPCRMGAVPRHSIGMLPSRL